MLEALDACPPVLEYSIEDHDVDILAGRQDVVQTTEADVVCPAVTTEDPDGLLGDELLALQDLSGLGVSQPAAAAFSSSAIRAFAGSSLALVLFLVAMNFS